MRSPLSALVLLGAIAVQSGATRPAIMEWAPAVEPLEAAMASANSSTDRTALNEMLLGTKGTLQYWTRTPELVVLMSVMDYRGVAGAESVGTAEQITDLEADDLVADLTQALSLLSGGNYQQFAAIHREVVPQGALAPISRPRQIVVGRFGGLRQMGNSIGFGGRSARADGTISGGAVVLDRDFDRTSSLRRLLRTHELGHALGFNHVHAQVSIMNPAIGPEPSRFDLMAVQVAFDSRHSRSAG